MSFTTTITPSSLSEEKNPKRNLQRFLQRISCVWSGYNNLLLTNRNYRLYLLSNICQHAGDWLVHVASLIAVNRLAPGSATAVSFLMLTRTIPDALLTPIGGMLADSFDRRKLMIAMDAAGSMAVLGYVAAIRMESIELLFTASAVRCTIHAIYEPTTRAIVPLLVTDADDLKRATTLHSIAWSSLMIMGGIVGGYASAAFGLQLCFVIDSFTYLISTFTMAAVTGDYLVSKEDKVSSHIDFQKDIDKKTIRQKIRARLWQVLLPVRHFLRMVKELIIYLWTCGFGLLAFMKGSGSITWGSSDVLNVSFAKVEGDEAATSHRLGLIFTFIGIGCLLGPVIINSLIDAKKPARLQLACISSLSFLVIGWIGMAEASESKAFGWILFFSTVRTIGSSIIWVDSTLLLQTLSSREMLGRVLGFEYSVSELCEAGAVVLAGRLEDKGYDENFISRLSATIGFSLLFLWSVYHLFGGAAANRRFNNPSDSASRHLHNLTNATPKHCLSSSADLI